MSDALRLATNMSMTTTTIMTGLTVVNATDAMETEATPTQKKTINLLRDSNIWIFFPSYFVTVGVFLCIVGVAVCLQRNRHIATQDDDAPCKMQCEDPDDVSRSSPSRVYGTSGVHDDSVFLDNRDSARILKSPNRNRGSYRADTSSCGSYRHDSTPSNSHRPQASPDAALSSVVCIFPSLLKSRDFNNTHDQSRDQSQEDQHNSWIAAGR